MIMLQRYVLPSRHACLFGLLSWCLLSQAAVATTTAPSDNKLLPELQAAAPSWQMHSQVRFRYWGVHAYDTALWTPAQFDPARWQSQAVALSITYARAIDVNDLIDRTFTEMTRQAKATTEQTNNWRQTLREAWRDVQPNDRITAVFKPPSRLAFYFNGQASKTIEDAVFAPRFMGIWLSSQTSQSGLRKALLTQQPALEVVHGW